MGWNALHDMKVRDIMEKDVISVRADATYEAVARTLFTHNITGAPVVDAAGALVGAVSEKDLFRILFPYYRSYYENPDVYLDYETREEKIREVREKKVTEFMSAPSITVGSDAPILRAAAVMLAKGIHRLPVVDDGRIVGIITRSRIFRVVVRDRLEAHIRKRP